MKKYGLLGKKLGHSFSKIIHNLVFDYENIDASYDLLECSSDELSKYIDMLKKGIYSGYNVTIPYKIEIMKYLDEVSQEALKIGSVNTVAYKDGKVIGYNTDYYGFIKTLESYNVECINKGCYILGTGGASLAIKAAVEAKGGRAIFVSRNKEGKANTISYEDLDKLDIIEVLINTTPVGMYPNVDGIPINASTCKKIKKCVDIIFNPIRTKLLQSVKEGYNGLLMLVGQAIKAEEIWNEQKISVSIDLILNKVVKQINE